MSFNKPHTQITRANYEEAFLLYIDGELDEEAMSAVEAFVLLNPDLQEEFDILMSTKLDAEILVLEGKESLLAEKMEGALSDEDLLLYIDDELSPLQKKNVEQKLASSTECKQQYQLFMRTKLVAEDGIVYPHKTELYCQTPKRVQPKFWMWAAAAVLALLFISMLWTNTVGTQQKVPNLVQAPNRKTEQPTPNFLQIDSVKPGLAARSTPKHKRANTEKLSIKKRSVSVQSPLPPPERINYTLVLPQRSTNGVTTPKSDANERAIVQQQTINNHAVTTSTESAYTITDDAATTEAGFSQTVAISNDNKKGSVRGFLRKASRFIERRTGISPVNEDDELLIGVVALKLK